jgi:hypothetical protein
MFDVHVALFAFTGSAVMGVLKTESFGMTGQPNI